MWRVFVPRDPAVSRADIVRAAGAPCDRNSDNVIYDRTAYTLYCNMLEQGINSDMRLSTTEFVAKHQLFRYSCFL